MASPLEVFIVFLRLGLTSFGGPIAHLAYFRDEFVTRRRWVSDNEYAQLLGLCQALPGPISSQLGFSLGVLRAGWMGAVAAFVAFTLPSASLMFVCAALFPTMTGTVGDAAIHGLKLVALAVVAHAVLGMARQLCPDVPRAAIAVCAVVIVLASRQPWMQLLVIAAGGIAGLVLCRAAQSVAEGRLQVGYSRTYGWTLLVVFAILLLGLPVAAQAWDGRFTFIDAFYRAGALVFGGGHVVLPLLETTVVDLGWISRDEFLAGYGAAQAVPGPMFSFAAYVGARLPDGAGGIIGASIALAAMFLPGLLLVAGVLPVWRTILSQPGAVRAIAGINAAVVGLLAAALYDPLWTSAVGGLVDVAIALIGLILLAIWRIPAIVVVMWCVAASVAGTLFL